MTPPKHHRGDEWIIFLREPDPAGLERFGELVAYIEGMRMAILRTTAEQAKNLAAHHPNVERVEMAKPVQIF